MEQKKHKFMSSLWCTGVTKGIARRRSYTQERKQEEIDFNHNNGKKLLRTINYFCLDNSLLVEKQNEN